MIDLKVDHKKILEHARAEGWTDRAIAREIGLSHWSVTKALNGIVQPSAPNLKKICDAIGFPIEQAFTETAKA